MMPSLARISFAFVACTMLALATCGAAFALGFNRGVGNFVWEDLNLNGVQDEGEPGVDGVMVALRTLDGQLAFFEPGLGTNPMMTAWPQPPWGGWLDSGGGQFWFLGLHGFELDYVLQVAVPPGYQITIKDAGADDQRDSDADPATGLVQVHLQPYNWQLPYMDNSWDIGLWRLTSVGGWAWEDGNGNGLQDDGTNSGIAGVCVELLDSTGQPSGRPAATTDSSGTYRFEGLTPGQYRLRFSLPNGYAFTTRGAGTADDSDVDPQTGVTGTIELLSGTPDWTWDAGLTQVE